MFGSFPQHQRDHKKTYLINTSSCNDLIQGRSITFPACHQKTKYCSIFLRKGNSYQEDFTWKQFFKFITCIEIDEKGVINKGKPDIQGYEMVPSQDQLIIRIAMFNPNETPICQINYNRSNYTFQIKISGFPYFHNQSNREGCYPAQLGMKHTFPLSPSGGSSQEITFPFCGSKIQNNPGRFTFQPKMNNLIKQLLRASQKGFLYFPENRFDLLNELSYISPIHVKVKQMKKKNPQISHHFFKKSGEKYLHVIKTHKII